MNFYVNEISTFSYEDLIDKINQKDKFYLEYYATDFIDFISNALACIINNEEFISVDFRNNEKKSNQNERQNKIVLNELDSLKHYIQSSGSSVGIYSSGTEGAPKLIYQPISRLLKSVQINDLYYQSKWAFTYNPSHSAGLQMFLQAVMNHACLFDFYKTSRNYILTTIKQHEINFLAGTPTFYRMLSPFDFSLEKVKSITFNGEKCTHELIESMKKTCPNAKIKNIYGSTESGPLMSSDNTTFVIPERLYNKVKINDNELMIHHSIMSPSAQSEEWYNTGDLVKIVSDDPLTIEFISRKSRIINVGGQNVNPQEIEESILQHPEIIDVQVIPKENKMIGNLITAAIVTTNKDLTEKDIIDFLKPKLASYKIPRIIKFVDSVSVGTTGKKNIR